MLLAARSIVFEKGWAIETEADRPANEEREGEKTETGLRSERLS